MMKLPSGYGTITKLSGKRRRPYWVRLACTYSSDGGRLTENRPTLGYYATRKEALEALHNYHNFPYDVTDKSTFADIFDKWITEKAKTVSTNTIYSYKAAFNACKPIHDTPLNDLKLADYQAILDSAANSSKSTVNNIKIVITGISAYGIQHELIQKDMTQYLTMQYTHKQGIHTPFTASEIQALWNDTIDTKERKITLILLYTGFRVNELLSMPAECVDLTAHTLRGGSKTEAGKNRIVPIHPQILPLVKSFNGDYPFKVNYNYYREWLHDTTGHTPHDTRHTFITELQNKGADKICIQRLVGHASADITDAVYTHKDLEQLRKTVELIDYSDNQ